MVMSDFENNCKVMVISQMPSFDMKAVKDLMGANSLVPSFLNMRVLELWTYPLSHLHLDQLEVPYNYLINMNNLISHYFMILINFTL